MAKAKQKGISSSVYQMSLTGLRRWDILKDVNESLLRKTRSFYVFHSQPYMGCCGGSGAFLINIHDEVFAVGHNCRNINILGVSKTSTDYCKDDISQPTIISGLTRQEIKEISIGGLVGAAITGNGSVFWWGQCYGHRRKIVTPHLIKKGKHKYLRVACGHRMMATLSVSNIVQVWGQAVNITSRYIDGQELRSRVVDIACGLHHLAMLSGDGFVYTWGRGDEGQRGLRTMSVHDQYITKRVSQETCKSISCGPFSTICVTNSNGIKACGTNHELHLGTLVNSKAVRTLSRVALGKPVTEITVIWGPDDLANIAAVTSTGEIYTWGVTQYPQPSHATSLIDVFTSWKYTPGLVRLKLPLSLTDQDFSNIITPRQLRTINTADVLKYVFLRNRPEGTLVHSRFYPRINSQQIAYLPKELTSQTNGKCYILDKFFNDIFHQSQIQPEPDEPIMFGIKCDCLSTPQGCVCF